VPSTAETTWTPLRRAEPTSTKPAWRVWPVLTPLTQPYSRTSVLRFLNVRGCAPEVSVICGESTVSRKNGLVRRTSASRTRSCAEE
jgi:hypothetical protein